jgi:hypothetical protein
MIRLKDLIGESSTASSSPGTRGYTGFLPSEFWDIYKKALNISVKKSTGYSIVGLDDIPTDNIHKTDNPINKTGVSDKNISERIKLKDLLFERIDYEDTANQMIKSYNLKSKVKFSNVKDKGDYDWISDIIYLRPSYPTIKGFLMTVLHEIHHAKQRKKLGAKKYEREYTIAGQHAEDNGGDFHDDNKFEEAAEKWAKAQIASWKK